MADRSPIHQVQMHPQLRHEQKVPSSSKALVMVTLLPISGGLLALSGVTLIGSLIGLAITTPLFFIFSPVLVPAAFVLGIAVVACLASGAFGLTGMTSLSWMLQYHRQATQAMPEQLDQVMKRIQDMAAFVGQKTKEMGQEIQRSHLQGNDK